MPSCPSARIGKASTTNECDNPESPRYGGRSATTRSTRCSWRSSTKRVERNYISARRVWVSAHPPDVSVRQRRRGGRKQPMRDQRRPGTPPRARSTGGRHLRRARVWRRSGLWQTEPFSRARTPALVVGVCLRESANTAIKGGTMTLRVGEPVPDQSVQAYVRGERAPSEFELSSHRGRWVVLFFSPRDFTFICPTELASFAERHDDFLRERAVVLAASTDSYHSHKAWFESDPRLAGV